MGRPRFDESARTASLRLWRRQNSGIVSRVPVASLLEKLGILNWRFLSLEQTDQIQVKLSEKIVYLRKSGLLHSLTDLDAKTLASAIDQQLKPVSSDAEVIIALSDFYSTGMLEFESTIGGIVVKELLDLDRDSLFIFEPNLSKGLILQRFEQRDDIWYQIEAWSSDSDTV